MICLIAVDISALKKFYARTVGAILQLFLL